MHVMAHCRQRRLWISKLVTDQGVFVECRIGVEVVEVLRVVDGELMRVDADYRTLLLAPLARAHTLFLSHAIPYFSCIFWISNVYLPRLTKS
jgi:hypothetical protein